MTLRAAPTILLAESAIENRVANARILEGAGYKTLSTDTGEGALQRTQEQQIDIVVANLCLPDMDGIELLKRVKTRLPDVPVILLVSHESLELSAEGIKEGAEDIVANPARNRHLLRAVDKAAKKWRLERECRASLSRADQKGCVIVYRSSQMDTVVRLIEQVAPSTAAVLITGQTGTGKEVVAEAIHAASPRRDRRLVRVSCAALPETLLEDELFGHERGAFTGAHARKEGRFELANGGTLFLDEIAEITPAIQIKLLRVLQNGHFERLGGTCTVNADVRIISATNKDLQVEIAAHRFREDLFYRLNVIDVRVPPLRERREDIPLLAMYFLKVFAERNHKKIGGFSDTAMNVLLAHDWPGNVRELENTVERAVTFTHTQTVQTAAMSQLPSSLLEPPPFLKFRIGMSWRELERQAIELTLAHTSGDKRKAARLLGVAPQLYIVNSIPTSLKEDCRRTAATFQRRNDGPARTK